MDILYTCGMWGMVPSDPAGAFPRIKEAGYDLVSLRAPASVEAVRPILDLARSLGLRLVGQFSTFGADADAHIRSFREFLPRLTAFEPLLVNSQTGSDFFAHADNVRIMSEMDVIARDAGLVLAHETHRGRGTFTIPATLRLLEELPDTWLTADFSHWCVVHECLLEDRRALLDQIIPRAVNIHARVGHAESPQVSDPRAPEWQAAVDAHVAWWDAIVGANRARGAKILTVHPEFGPPGYMPTLPFTDVPVSDLFAINRSMKDRLKPRWAKV
ncbi:MAG: sugar phosphate isomerase/epimerase [Planctomycetes bacterium]|nr:sugar phosphate isomerase/epimerase [Planctomycetota bacterium]